MRINFCYLLYRMTCWHDVIFKLILLYILLFLSYKGIAESLIFYPNIKKDLQWMLLSILIAACSDSNYNGRCALDGFSKCRAFAWKGTHKMNYITSGFSCEKNFINILRLFVCLIVFTKNKKTR